MWAALRAAAIEEEVRELLVEARALYKKKGGVVSCQVGCVLHLRCHCRVQLVAGGCTSVGHDSVNGQGEHRGSTARRGKGSWLAGLPQAAWRP